MNLKPSYIMTSILIFAWLLSRTIHVTSQEANWVRVDEGLDIGEFHPLQKSVVGDSKILVIKIDPTIYSFKLLCASELKHANLTAKQWSRKYNLLGAINAGMFQIDHSTNVGYMKNYQYINNPQINSKYHSVAAFNPIDSTKSDFRIHDVDQEDMGQIIRSYDTIIQNLRLIKRPGKNRWSQQDKKWSEAALGQDKAGNILFIFSRSPFSMHDFNNILLDLPIGIQCAQHLEGGPEASLYFRHNKNEIEAFGSYETDFNENDHNSSYWPIPNVIGFVKN